MTLRGWLICCALLVPAAKFTVHMQEGHGQHNKHGEGIEHFGYVDGRSQPIFLTEDLDKERLQNDGTTC